MCTLCEGMISSPLAVWGCMRRVTPPSSRALAQEPRAAQVNGRPERQCAIRSITLHRFLYPSKLPLQHRSRTDHCPFARCKPSSLIEAGVYIYLCLHSCDGARASRRPPPATFLRERGAARAAAPREAAPPGLTPSPRAGPRPSPHPAAARTGRPGQRSLPRQPCRRQNYTHPWRFRAASRSSPAPAAALARPWRGALPRRGAAWCWSRGGWSGSSCSKPSWWTPIT